MVVWMRAGCFIAIRRVYTEGRRKKTSSLIYQKVWAEEEEGGSPLNYEYPGAFIISWAYAAAYGSTRINVFNKTRVCTARAARRHALRWRISVTSLSLYVTSGDSACTWYGYSLACGRGCVLFGR